jgi:hypothetical protein
MMLAAAFGVWGRFNKLEARQVDMEARQSDTQAKLQDLRDHLDRIELILLEDENEQRANQDRSQREKQRRASLK